MGKLLLGIVVFATAVGVAIAWGYRKLLGPFDRQEM